MVTYGDMVTLLLCFFVLIVSFSEIKKEDEWNAVVEEIKKSFGMKGGGGKLPTKDDPELTLIERLEAVQLQQQREPQRSNTLDPGQDGREANVTTVREGMRFLIGGRIGFEVGEAVLDIDGQRALAQIAEQLRGQNNLVELRGHADSAEQGQGPYPDLWELSYARARAVRDYLVEAHEMDPDRFRLVANADREPLVHRKYNVSAQQPNRRVEVIATENLVQDFQRPQDGAAP